jgi:hypothetical protein
VSAYRGLRAGRPHRRAGPGGNPAGRPSHSLAKLAALEAARGSFDAAYAAVARRCGPVIGKRQLEQAVVHAAADIPAFYAAQIPEPGTGPGRGGRRRVRRGRGPRPRPPADRGRPGRRRRAPAKPDPRRGRPPRSGDPHRDRPGPRHEYIWKAAWSLHDAGDPAAEDRVAAKALAVLAGDSARASQEITAQAGSAGLTPSRRTARIPAPATGTPGTSTCATTRLSQTAGPSRPASSRAPAGTSPTASTAEGPARHQAGKIRTRRLNGYLTPEELHPSRNGTGGTPE